MHSGMCPMKKSIAIIMLLVSAAIALYFANVTILYQQKQRREAQRNLVHENAIQQFKNSLKSFGLIVSGLRSYMKTSPTIIDDETLQDYWRATLRETSFDDPIVVSIIDTTHNFIYSFDQFNINPNDLVGKNVGDFSTAAVNRYDQLMPTKELHLLGPHNLVEGKVGISLNFSIYKDNQVIGYAIPILFFESTIDDLYDSDLSDEFIFHFRTGDGIDFDRKKVYNNTKVYHTDEDELYYKNFELDSVQFVYRSFEIFDSIFQIGIADTEETSSNLIWIPASSILWYTFFLFLVSYVLRQSKQLEKANADMEKHRKQLSESLKELKAADASKNRFFSIIGHDIKGPLRSIQNIINLRNAQISPQEINDFFADLQEVTENTLDLLDNLLQWASLTKNNTQVSFTEVSLNELLEKIVELNKGITQLKGIKVMLDLETGLIIEGDHNMLATVFRNIISNAIKFTYKGGMIEISGERKGKKAAITVKDNGTGMSAKELEDLFRLDKETISKGTDGELGTGLGLILSKEYTEIHGGKIIVVSIEQVGSTFTISLPVAQNQ